MELAPASCQKRLPNVPLQHPLANLVRAILEDAVNVADRATVNVENQLLSAVKQLEVERERLKGVVVHWGTLEHGHYVSVVERARQWYFCNDKVVSECGEKVVMAQEAYMLFYERARK